LTPAKGEKPWLWTVRTNVSGSWKSQVLPGWLRTHQLLEGLVDSVLVTAVSRTGIESAAATAGGSVHAIP